jgi:two-component system, chemotaxis family, chemotaxis protein CheY
MIPSQYDNPTRHFRILVVDDDDLIRDCVAYVLEEEGFEVAKAANGQAALEKATSQPPNLILLDMRMPVLDGWGFARKYSEQPGPRAPIVVMTAATDAGAWAREVGADDFLPKPFDIPDLVDCVTRLTHSPMDRAS